MMICLHTQWALLRPCKVVLPFQLPPGEHEFWMRFIDAGGLGAGSRSHRR